MRAGPVRRRDVLTGKAAQASPIAAWLTVVRTDFKNSGFVDLAVPLVGLGWAVGQRGETAKSLEVLEEAAPKASGAPRPKIVIKPSKAAGKVSVEMLGPKLDGEIVDYLWLRDADSGQLLGSKALKANDGRAGSNGDPTYSCLLDVGRRVVPFMHSSNSGLWKGEAFVARL